MTTPHLGREFPRGSEWRKWDLQVHTPYSVLNHQFGSDFDAYARTLIERAVEGGIAVVGVTDYFTVAGYRKLRDRLADSEWLSDNLAEGVAEAATRLLVLANVELRSTPIVQVGTDEARVNLHVLFSDDCGPDEIETYFLHQLSFTATSVPGAPDEKWPLTVAHLEDIGRRLKSEHDRFQGSDLKVGMTCAAVAHEKITEVLQNQASRFKGRYFLAVAADEDLAAISWDGQAHLARKVLIQKSHLIFSSNAGTRQFALGKRHPSVEAFVREFIALPSIASPAAPMESRSQGRVALATMISPAAWPGRAASMREADDGRSA